MSPLLPTHLKKWLRNSIIHNCTIYCLHLLLVVGVTFAYPLQRRCLLCSLSLFLRFQRTMLLVYCIVWQHFVNFLVVFITILRKKISLASKIAISQYSLLGKTSAEKSRLLSGIAQISEPPPTPQFGQLGPLFSGRQNDVLRV